MDSATVVNKENPREEALELLVHSPAWRVFLGDIIAPRVRLLFMAAYDTNLDDWLYRSHARELLLLRTIVMETYRRAGIPAPAAVSGIFGDPTNVGDSRH